MKYKKQTAEEKVKFYFPTPCQPRSDLLTPRAAQRSVRSHPRLFSIYAQGGWLKGNLRHAKLAMWVTSKRDPRNYNESTLRLGPTVRFTQLSNYHSYICLRVIISRIVFNKQKNIHALSWKIFFKISGYASCENTHAKITHIIKLIGQILFCHHYN